MNDSNERRRGVILSYVSIIASTLVQLIYTPLLIRMLGQSEYGLYSLVASIIGYLTVLDLGFGNAIVVYTSKYRAEGKYEAEKKLHGMFKIIFYIIGVIVALIGVFLYFNVDKFFGSTMTATELSKAKIMMLILAVNLVITFSFNIYSSIITAYEKFTFQKIMSIANTILKPIIMIPFLFMGYKSIAMVVIITLINVFIVLSNYFYCKVKLKVNVKFKGFDKSLFFEILSYSIFIFLAVIVDKINWSVDQFILGAVSGTVAVSLYSVASQINSLFTNLSTAVSGVLLPKMSKMVASDASNEQLTDEFIKVGRIQFYIIFLMVTGFILVGREFMIVWAGADYETSYYIAVILITPLSIPLIQNLGISIMQAKNMHKFRSILYTVIAIANVIISIPLAKLYGGIGSAIGTSLSLLIGNIIVINIYYHKRVGLNMIKFWKNILKMLIYYIVPIIVVVLLIIFIPLKGIWNVLIFGAIYTILYCLISYFIVMDDYEKNIIDKMLIKFHLKRRK